jgi:peptide/nickel transport system permease protein
LVAVAFLSTLLAYLVGIAVGAFAGLRGGRVDLALVALVDLLIAFPPVILVLGLVAAAGTGLRWVGTAIALAHAPRIARIVRAVTQEVAAKEWVEVATARGDGTATIIARDIVPNIWTPVLADFGLRLTGSVILFSSLSFLGFGPAPPAADWGLMISENRAGILTQPWVIVVPAATIALLAIGVNLVADSVARSTGRSIVARDG